MNRIIQLMKPPCLVVVILLIQLLVAGSQTCSASEYRLKCLTWYEPFNGTEEGTEFWFSYDENNKINLVEFKDFRPKYLFQVWNLDWSNSSEGKLSVEIIPYSDEFESMEYGEHYHMNYMLNSNMCTYASMVEELLKFSQIYDERNRMTQTTYEVARANLSWNLTWDDTKLQKIEGISLDGKVDYYYEDAIGTWELKYGENPIENKHQKTPVFYIVAFDAIDCATDIFGPLSWFEICGQQIGYLPTEISSDRYKVELSWTLNTDGYPVSCEVRNEEGRLRETFIMEWEEMAISGMNGLSQSKEKEIISIYDISGKKLNNTQKGINIVKYGDGSVKKVFVK